MNIKWIKKKEHLSRTRRNEKLYVNKLGSFQNIFIFLCAIFLIGILLGTIYFVNGMPEKDMEGFKNPFQEKALLEDAKDRKDIFIEIAVRNMIVLLAFWMVGLSIVGAPILIFYIFYEGASFGLSLSYILFYLGLYKGYSYIYVSMYVSSFINVLSMIILCCSAIKVTSNILKKSRDIKSELVRHSTVCLIIFVVFVFSSILETHLVEIGKNLILN